MPVLNYCKNLNSLLEFESFRMAIIKDHRSSFTLCFKDKNFFKTILIN